MSKRRAVADHGAEFENGLGAVEVPAGAGDVEAVLDQMSAGAVDAPGGDPLRSTVMARSLGIVCYVLAGLVLAAALVIPIIGYVQIMLLWLNFDLTILETLIMALRRVLGPIPTMVAVLTVEIALTVGAVILILIGLRLRRRPRSQLSPSR
jgi:hypothetical protein